MSKLAKEKKEYHKMEMRKYTDAELRDFHEKVQKYYFDFTDKDGMVMRVMDKKKLMMAFGATTETGAVIIDEVSLPPNRLQQFENCYEQWQYWKVKVGIDKGSWVYKKNLEQLDEIAETMKIEAVEESIPF